MKTTDYYKIKEKKNIEITKRVLFSEINNETPKRKGRKTFYSQERYFRNSTRGDYLSLMERTPDSFPIKGKKKLNKSIDSGNRPDNDLFLRKQIDERKDNLQTDRIFGVERKRKIIENNFESGSVRLKQSGRKHFKIEDKVG